MDGGVKFMRNNKNTDIINCYKGQEIEENHDRLRPERARYIKKMNNPIILRVQSNDLTYRIKIQKQSQYFIFTIVYHKEVYFRDLFYIPLAVITISIVT